MKAGNQNKTIWIVFDSLSQTQSQPMSHEKLQLAILRMSEGDWSRFFIWQDGWQNWQPLKDFLLSGQNQFVSNVPLQFNEFSSEDTIKRAIRDVVEPTSKSTTKKKKKEKTRTQTITKSVTNIKSSTEQTNAKEKTHYENYDVDELSWSKTKPVKNIKFDKSHLQKNSYLERASRHQLKIEMLLVNLKGSTFRSYSKNISLSGSYLEHVIPAEYCGTTFDVVIINRHAHHQSRSRVQVKATTIGDGLTQRIQFIKPSEQTKEKLNDLFNDYLSNPKHQKKSA